MGIKTFKPVTQSRRQFTVSDFAELTDKHRKPEKSLLAPYKRKGAVTIKGTHQPVPWGGHKRRYRLIVFKRKKDKPGQRCGD